MAKTKNKAKAKAKTKSSPAKVRTAISSKALPPSAQVQKDRDFRAASLSSEALASPLASKTFSQLTAAEKDTLLEVIALRLGLVKPA